MSLPSVLHCLTASWQPWPVCRVADQCSDRHWQTLWEREERHANGCQWQDSRGVGCVLNTQSDQLGKHWVGRGKGGGGGLGAAGGGGRRDTRPNLILFRLKEQGYGWLVFNIYVWYCDGLAWNFSSPSLYLSELRSCVKVEGAVLGSPSLIVLMVSVDVKQHWT